MHTEECRNIGRTVQQDIRYAEQQFVALAAPTHTCIQRAFFRLLQRMMLQRSWNGSGVDAPAAARMLVSGQL
jgi:hypothetical protein